jgi:RNA polymerase sigma-70 factor, ECF subfamily
MNANKQQFEQIETAQSSSRKAFLRLIETIRPKLHLYCTRMSGSVVDAEDIVQESLATAFYKLQNLKDPSKLESWLFSIAHNKTIDLLRGQQATTGSFDEDEYMDDTHAEPIEPHADIKHALKVLVTQLPPKERACIVLKDIMDTPLHEIASIVDSTTGGVKSALHRGRRKLNKLTHSAIKIDAKAHERDLITLYLDYFNQQNWDGVESLLRADARLELVGIEDRAGREFIKHNYFINYQNWRWRWKLELALVDGVEMIVHFRADDDKHWIPHAIVKLEWLNRKVTTVRDYIHVDYLLESALVRRI